LRTIARDEERDKDKVEKKFSVENADGIHRWRNLTIVIMLTPLAF